LKRTTKGSKKKTKERGERQETRPAPRRGHQNWLGRGTLRKSKPKTNRKKRVREVRKEGFREKEEKKKPDKRVGKKRAQEKFCLKRGAKQTRKGQVKGESWYPSVRKKIRREKKRGEKNNGEKGSQRKFA